MKSKTIFAAIGILGVSLVGTASATWEWTFPSESNDCWLGGDCPVNSRSYTGTSTTSDPAPGVTGTAWSNSEPPVDNQVYGDGKLMQRYLASYSGGLGVINSSGDGDHEVDNKGWIDSVLLSFESDVTLNELTFGWIDEDADFTLAAYLANDGTNNSTDLTQWEYDELTTKGWEVIGSYYHTGGSVTDGSTRSFSVNPGNQSSSYWLVSALNPKLDPLVNLCCTGNDKFKVHSAAGHAPPQPPAQIPEPSVVSMFLIGLMGAAWMHRRRNRLAGSPGGEMAV